MNTIATVVGYICMVGGAVIFLLYFWMWLLSKTVLTTQGGKTLFILADMILALRKSQKSQDFSQCKKSDDSNIGFVEGDGI